MFFQPEWHIVDPICTFMFSILVLATTYAIIKDTVLVLMEGMPKNNQFVAVLDTLLNISGVIRVHNLRIWALSLDKTVLSAHLVIGKYFYKFTGLCVSIQPSGRVSVLL